MAQEMRFQDNWRALAGLKDHAMHEETKTGINRMIAQMTRVVLEQIGNGRRIEAMAPVMIRIKGDTREWFSGFQVVMLTQHVRSSLNQPYGFLANAVIVTCVVSLRLCQQTQQIANT